MFRGWELMEMLVKNRYSAGEVVLSPIRDSRGKVLFGEGHLLDSRDIAKLREHPDTAFRSRNYGFVPGMILNSPVSDDKGNVICPEGLVLTRTLIEKFSEMGIHTLDVRTKPDMKRTDGYGGVSRPDLRKTQKYVYEVMDTTLRERGFVREGISDGKGFAVHMATLCDGIFRKGPVMLEELKSLFHYDEYTFRHSVEVMVTALLLARKIEDKGIRAFTPKQRLSLAVGTALHDIGKRTIPRSTITKPGKLNDEEFANIKRHPIHGRVIMRRLEDEFRETFGDRIDMDLVEAVVGGHHLRPDGRGYGVEMKPGEIPDFVWISGIADAYDAMATDRSYQSGKHPKDILGILASEKGKQFNPEFVDVFSEIVLPYPVNSLVLLDNGTVGVVDAFDKGEEEFDLQVLASLTLKGAIDLLSAPRGTYPSRKVKKDDIALGVRRVDEIESKLRKLMLEPNLSPAMKRLLAVIGKEGVSLTSDKSLETYINMAIDVDGIRDVIHDRVEEERNAGSIIREAVRSKPERKPEPDLRERERERDREIEEPETMALGMSM